MQARESFFFILFIHNFRIFYRKTNLYLYNMIGICFMKLSANTVRYNILHVESSFFFPFFFVRKYSLLNFIVPCTIYHSSDIPTRVNQTCRLVTYNNLYIHVCCKPKIASCIRDRRHPDLMVDWLTTTCANSAYHHYSCESETRSWRGVLDTIYD